MSRQERIKELEDELSKTKYNKKTQHHIGLIKAKIAKLKQEDSQKKKGTGATDGYTIKKSGDATVAMVGFPSVGKSTLLNAITNAESKVAAYQFTTLDVIPGLLEYKHAKIQIFDVPGIVEGAAAGTGRGREVLAAIRAADLIMLMLDINQMKHHDILQKEIYDAGLRLNQQPPDVKIIKKTKGGIDISKTVKLDISDEMISDILNEFRIINAGILIRTKINEDQLIDVLEANKVYTPCIKIINKIDSVDKKTLQDVKKKHPDAVYISASEDMNLEALKTNIYEKLQLMSIFLKEPMKDADMEEPLVMKKRDDLQRLCEKLHRDFINKFKFARIWGESVHYDGQKITNLKHELKDQDIVEVHLR